MLSKPRGQATYRRRQRIVEPVFATANSSGAPTASSAGASPEQLLQALADLDRIELVYAPAGGGRGRPRVRRYLGEAT
jgi:hypothetical protein